MSIHYGILINEENLALIKFLNDGVLPAEINQKMWKKSPEMHYFCFSIDSAKQITVLKNSVRHENSLWNREGTFRKNDRNLLIG